MMDQELMNITREMVDAPKRYGARKSLEHRYESAANAMIPEIVLNQIKKNVIEDHASE